MSENLADSLLKCATVLRWFEKYNESNALILLSRLLRAYGIDDLEHLDDLVQTAEANP